MLNRLAAANQNHTLGNVNSSGEPNDVLFPEKPSPVTEAFDVVVYKRRMGAQYALDALAGGYNVLISDYFSSGLEILKFVKQYTSRQHPDQSFAGQRKARAAYREMSQRLWLKIVNGNLQVRKSPEIGWFQILYPGLKEFLLTFPDVQGLNSAWQWYKKGIYIPVLNQKIHPWYGTYFPTRFSHLELFDTWLKQYNGPRESAIDIGTGSGVLMMLLQKHGFGRLFGTDINPNALIGLNACIMENRASVKPELRYGDLFADLVDPAEVIVFNPPWLPAVSETTGLDRAIYYEPDLFPRFFNAAENYLNDNGKLVLLFSNLARISGLSDTHPVEAELADQKRFRLEKHMKKSVPAASVFTKRNTVWRGDELVELWVLTHQ